MPRLLAYLLHSPNPFFPYPTLLLPWVPRTTLAVLLAITRMLDLHLLLSALTHDIRNIGAVAELFDISRYYGQPLFNNSQDIAIEAWSSAPANTTPADFVKAFQLSEYFFGKLFNPTFKQRAIIY